MGVVRLTCQMVLYTLVVALVLMVVPGIPPHYKFEAYSIRPPRKLEGKLTPNDILDRAELVVDGQFVGPESVAVRRDEVFTGVEDGHIIKVDANGKWKKVVKIGDGKCDGTWRSPCVRPLGLRFNKQGKLLVADANKGIHEVDVDKGTSQQILSPSTPISDGISANIVDDLDIDNDGIIYFSDVSKTCSLHNFFDEALGEPTGRLIKFDPKTKKGEVLMDGIHAANGVQLSRQEDFLVVCETMRSRLWKYYLKGPKKGMKEVFVEGLPGLPDNVRSNGKGGFYVSLVVPDTEENPSQLRKLMPLPSVKKLLLRTQHILLKVVETIGNLSPNAITKMAHVYVSHLGPLGDWTAGSKQVIIVDIDETGNIIGSLQNKNGHISFISEIGLGEKYTYFGSPFSDKFWRIKTEYLV